MIAGSSGPVATLDSVSISIECMYTILYWDGHLHRYQLDMCVRLGPLG